MPLTGTIEWDGFGKSDKLQRQWTPPENKYERWFCVNLLPPIASPSSFSPMAMPVERRQFQHNAQTGHATVVPLLKVS